LVWVLVTAIFSESALSLHKVVADFVRLGAGLAAPLLLFTSSDAVPILIEAGVLFPVLETATVSKFALTVFLKIKALSTRRVGDRITFGVFILALVAVPATALVAERTAHLFCCCFGHIISLV
jgi:hypothetical protein